MVMRDGGAVPDPVAEYSIILPQQTHSLHVRWVTAGDLERFRTLPADSPGEELFPDTDGLLTRERGVALGVRTADCIPVLLYARDIQAAGAVHAGWRGALGGIPGRAVEMLKEAGADPAEIFVRFGPGICVNCFETGEDVARKFREAGYGDCVAAAPKEDPLTGETPAPDKPHVDLVKVCERQLIAAGVPVTNLYRSDLCTRHTSLTVLAGKEPGTLFPYHSWRREHGTEERNTTFVLLIPR